MDRLHWRTKTCGVFLLWAVAATGLSAQTFTMLHSFDGTDGENPFAGPVQGTNGSLYGTTSAGGANNCANGCGTTFKVTPGGALTTLHSFDGTDGSTPFAGLFQGNNGNFYGTTYHGGVNNEGTVFKITPSGRLATIYNFCSQTNCGDGAMPYAGLIQATDGDFYGTTAFGGPANPSCYDDSCGTVFKITPSGELTTLHSFDNTDGQGPYAGLVQITNGELYGTTNYGGANNDGTVFKITPQGTLTMLHSFDGTDGYGPYAGLVQATDGNLYGTTLEGGANDTCGLSHGCGTVYKITPSGTLTTLYSFCSQSNCTDGYYPDAALVQGTDGNLYGTAYQGGANGNYGTVFKITLNGILTTLYDFCAQLNCTDGYIPSAGLAQDTNGTFYGTTVLGGANNTCASGCGTVFSLSVGLGPFVKTLPMSGKVGTAVDILGTKLTSATSVTFNGTAATFTVNSKSEITTTVPTGATTGVVQVETPGGTLSSNMPFRVN